MHSIEKHLRRKFKLQRYSASIIIICYTYQLMLVIVPPSRSCFRVMCLLMAFFKSSTVAFWTTTTAERIRTIYCDYLNFASNKLINIMQKNMLSIKTIIITTITITFITKIYIMISCASSPDHHHHHHLVDRNKESSSPYHPSISISANNNLDRGF